ncbi:SGNH/GDSL hydrolase family protein [Actinophytocola oryzae]|uniref:SGNH/GDSL hydrolase family protein n=1 Tax=Actinophytocola oryzae TaxID=502181 RepID=UPI001FB92132|nr:SGNH/GDSL hydrolase family protein [Actinophytocola oryzae]
MSVRYAAIGDSFTEGVGDEQPDGSVRGWADLVAVGLAREEAVQYVNLAVRGRLLAPIVSGQLETALALDPPPTLVTFNGGGNDMLRPRTDVAELVALTTRAVRRCLDAGVRLVLLSGADPSDQLPFGRTIRRRGEELTARVAELAAANDIPLVDVFHDTEIRRQHYWSADRLHLNATGHERVAGLVLAALDGAPAPQPNDSPPQVARGLAAEARYYWQHVLPWVNRRLRGRSSGDTLDAKHPVWTVIEQAGV